MEKEIDDLFLYGSVKKVGKDRIRTLEKCMGDLPKINPNLEQVWTKCKEIDSSLELYSIKLESLAREMKGIEKENTKLENEIQYQTSIYEHLKELLINVEIKEDHFITLESESFDSIDGLCRIEKALEVLDGFHVDEYDIRIVREKKERINDALREFYKRFITYMGSFMVDSESSGDLKVHKGLYGAIKRFKKIFQHSKRYRDYYVVLCSIYMARSKKLYEREFGFHLKTVLRLLKEDVTQDKMDRIFETLFESYRSIVKCEDRFLKSMEIDGTCQEIFRNTGLLIVGFVEDAYDIADIEVLNGLGKIWKEVEPDEDVYGSFQKELREVYGRLEEEYLKKKMGKGENGVGKLEEILSRSSNEDLKRKAIVMGTQRIMEEEDKGDLRRIVKRWRLLDYMGKKCTKEIEEVLDAERKTESEFEKSCADMILGSGKTVDNVKKVLSLINGEKGFKTKVIRKMREMVSNDVEEKDAEDADKLLREAM
ncbi:exocyst complex component Sec3-like protein [Encephalitozoon intestinalis ATCC 50506]|uniref:Exocyst complex component Sec3-like protein n=1 Tax=Encephalitozoon intestinalis (strain ATCC 50506) TaxID=876142 RepID=E0S802_ENCIT|nr:exocyst complex component Sec3-like protein [Encephalitozoon intestinalis ATCC 50506]ADM11837.1 exocyst complex component Sec3-like protein [Encephalitozoon intestinalis ATCC 50506]UTX45587.1 exocyst complex component Sec3 [Encephalitozoon intestinalis]